MARCGPARQARRRSCRARGAASPAGGRLRARRRRSAAARTGSPAGAEVLHAAALGPHWSGPPRASSPRRGVSTDCMPLMPGDGSPGDGSAAPAQLFRHRSSTSPAKGGGAAGGSWCAATAAAGSSPLVAAPLQPDDAQRSGAAPPTLSCGSGCLLFCFSLVLLRRASGQPLKGLDYAHEWLQKG